MPGAANETGKTMNRKLIHFIAAALVVLLGGILYLLLDLRDTDEGIDVGGSPFSGPEHSGEQGFLSEKQIEKLFLAGDPAAEYEAYKAYARYPHESRPLNARMKDLTEPWKVAFVRLPIVTDPALATENSFKAYLAEQKEAGKSPKQVQAELKTALKNSYGYQFEANRHTLTAGDELVVKLSVTSPAGDVVPVRIVDSQLKGDENFGTPALGSVDFNDEGSGADTRAEDRVYTAAWKLPGTDKKYWGNLELTVRAAVEGLKDEVVLRHHFYASPIVPAVFTGEFSERLENGSLVIDQVVDVKKECRFTIQANLYNVEEDVPTHWVTVQKVLSPGKQIVSFLFFGKIFRDGGHEGRFRMQNLRGTCDNLPFPVRYLGDPARVDQIVNAEPLKEPLLHYMPFTDLTFTTRNAYGAAVFSDQEWESDEKTSRLEALQSQKPL